MQALKRSRSSFITHLQVASCKFSHFNYSFGVYILQFNGTIKCLLLYEKINDEVGRPLGKILGHVCPKLSV